METDNIFDPVFFAAEVAFLALCAALFVWTSRKDKNSPPAVWRKPLSARMLLSPRKSEGDHLAARKDWWLLHICIAGFSIAFTLLSIAVDGFTALLSLVVFLLVSLIFLLAFLYFGAQRFIAAGHSGYWIFAVLIVQIISAGLSAGFESNFVLYVINYAVSVATVIFVGVIPDKTESRPTPTEAQTTH